MGDELKVLVIEDSLFTVALLDVTFKRHPDIRAKFCTGDATTAIRLAREGQPHVIVLDYLINGEFTGPELAPRLRQAAPDAGILLFTGSVDREEAATAAHIDASLDKMEMHLLLPTMRELARPSAISARAARSDSRGDQSRSA